MVDFRKMLSPKTRAENDSRLNRIVDFQEMDNAARAATLLQASRTLIDSAIFLPESPIQSWGNAEWAIYSSIPGLAVALDPEVKLREDELAGEGETWDPLVQIRAGKTDAILDTLAITLNRKIFDRALSAGAGIREAAIFLYDPQKRGSALEIAMDILAPGRYPFRATRDIRDPLEGFQLIGTHGDHDRVLRYAETREELDDLYRVTAAKRLMQDLDDGEEQLLKQLRVWPERLDFDALSLQSCAGEILEEMQVENSGMESDAEPEF